MDSGGCVDTDQASSSRRISGVSRGSRVHRCLYRWHGHRMPTWSKCLQGVTTHVHMDPLHECHLFTPPIPRECNSLDSIRSGSPD